MRLPGCRVRQRVAAKVAQTYLHQVALKTTWWANVGRLNNSCHPPHSLEEVRPTLYDAQLDTSSLFKASWAQKFDSAELVEVTPNHCNDIRKEVKSMTWGLGFYTWRVSRIKGTVFASHNRWLCSLFGWTAIDDAQSYRYRWWCTCRRSHRLSLAARFGCIDGFERA